MEVIKAIVYGVGAMGRILPKLLLEKGVNIVGAIDVNPEIVGKDLGEVAGLDYHLNVLINNNPEEVLSKHKADIALVAIFSEMEKMYPYLKMCVESGLNVITTCEEAAYPWTISPELAAKLDKLARDNGVTVTGSGFQDVYEINLISVLSGASHKIESITGREKFNIEEYGPVVLEYYNIGVTKEEYEDWIMEQKVDQAPFSDRMNLESLIADLGLTVKKVRQTIKPIIANEDTEAESIGKLIKRGEVIGRTDIVEIETEQGIKFQGEMIGKVYKPGEGDINEWYIKGVPALHLKNDNVPSRIATCTQMVNRIPDVINSEPGFITAEKLPKPKYKSYPLHLHLRHS
ncbi:dihydrodipicolinate reductase [Chloroflexota bacterium]